MKKYIQVIAVSLSAIFIFGCASTGDNLQRETARSIGGNVSPEQVTVSDIDRGATSVKWKAAAIPKRLFAVFHQSFDRFCMFTNLDCLHGISSWIPGYGM